MADGNVVDGVVNFTCYLDGPQEENLDSNEKNNMPQRLQQRHPVYLSQPGPEHVEGVPKDIGRH